MDHVCVVVDDDDANNLARTRVLTQSTSNDHGTWHVLYTTSNRSTTTTNYTVQVLALYFYSTTTMPCAQTCRAYEHAYEDE